MFFNIIIILVFLGVAYFHYAQGLLAATISLVCAAVAAFMAFSYHETIVVALTGGRLAAYANGAMLCLLFALIYSVLRFFTDNLVPGNARYPVALDKGGAAVVGLLAAIFPAAIPRHRRPATALRPRPSPATARCRRPTRRWSCPTTCPASSASSAATARRSSASSRSTASATTTPTSSARACGSRSTTGSWRWSPSSATRARWPGPTSSRRFTLTSRRPPSRAAWAFSGPRRRRR